MCIRVKRFSFHSILSKRLSSTILYLHSLSWGFFFPDILWHLEFWNESGALKRGQSCALKWKYHPPISICCCTYCLLNVANVATDSRGNKVTHMWLSLFAQATFLPDLLFFQFTYCRPVADVWRVWFYRSRFWLYVVAFNLDPTIPTPKKCLL